MKDYDNIFDIRMRSILEEGQQELPADLWNGIESRLDAGTSQKHIAPSVWMRRAAVALAAVAAVVLAVIFTGKEQDPSSRQIEAVSGETMLSQAVQTPDPIRITHEEDFVPQKVSGNFLSIPAEPSANTEESTEIEEAEEIVHADDIQTVNEEGSTPEKKEKISEDKPSSWNDIFSELPQEKTRRKARMAITAYGNASSNTLNGGGVKFSPIAHFAKGDLPAAMTKSYISENSESSYMIPMTFGIGTKIGISKKWSVGIGVNTTLLSRSFSGTFTEIDESGRKTETAYNDIRNRQQYIGIPVNFYFDIVKQKAVNFYAYAGGTVEKCVSNKYVMFGPASEKVVFNSPASGVQLSAGIGIGAQFNVSKHIGIYIDPNVRYYFKMNQPASIRTRQPLMAGFELGLRINL